MIKKPELISNKLPFERLAIGSAQFGFNYGIMNTVGQTNEADIQKILDVARNYRINTIDTAVAYGESEKLLGKIGVDDFNVMSKISFSDTEYKDLIKWGEDKVRRSIELLNIKNLNTVFLHGTAKLNKKNDYQLIEALLHLKELGLTEKIGISLYSLSEVRDLNYLENFDIVQAPLNILNSNKSLMENSYKQKKYEIYARSIFLQGILLTNPDNLPLQFAKYVPLWQEIFGWIKDQNISPLEACINYVLSYTKIKKIIVGVDSLSQFEKLVASKYYKILSIPEWKNNIDSNLIDPRKWKDYD